MGFPKGQWGDLAKEGTGKSSKRWNEEKENQYPWPRCCKVLQPLYTAQRQRAHTQEKASASNIWVNPLTPSFQIFKSTYSSSQIPKNMFCLKCCYMILFISKTLKYPAKPTRLTKHSKPIHCFLYKFKLYKCPCLQSLTECS